ncbi:MAG TPA: S-adenosylmethionine:tRNA ribosyltransferase-isomerase [Chloroflexota bacterium]
MLVLEDALDFTLPPELEAHEPPEARGRGRDDVRLLVTCRATNEIVHARFADLPTFLSPGDLLVVNDSGTLPAELTALTESGESISLRLSTRLAANRWMVEPRAAGVRPGQVLALPGGGSGTLLQPYSDSRRLWIAQVELPVPFTDYLLRWGRPIRYAYVPRAWPLGMYQTVYSRELGSAEMPSAGRPFTCEMVDRLRAQGVDVATITLHTGVASPESHEPPYEEWYRVPGSTAEAVERAKVSGGRVIAVGTTVVRALESAVDAAARLRPAEGWTRLVITPERGVRVVDGLLTGFHEPRSTHLAMLEALATREHLELAYRAAIAGRYLWHEFGDLHLIL